MSHFAEGTDLGESPAVSSLSLQGCFCFFALGLCRAFVILLLGIGREGRPRFFQGWKGSEEGRAAETPSLLPPLLLLPPSNFGENRHQKKRREEGEGRTSVGGVGVED